MFVRKRARGQGLVAFGVFLAICLAGNVSGSAAAAPAGSAQFGAGAHAVVACQSGALSVGFDTAYDPQLGGYEVTTVRLGGLDTQGAGSCAGQPFDIVLADGQGRALSQRSGTTPSSGVTFSVDIIDAHVLVSDVASVHVTLLG